MRDLISALAVCNNVTPVQSAVVADFDIQEDELNLRNLQHRRSFQGDEKPVVRQSIIEQEPQLEASSPDEVALVKFGYQVKTRLMERTRTECRLVDINGNEEVFEILASFPFTSESKKMGVLLKSRETGRNIYFLKGAEIVMEHKIKVGARPSLLESCENLAMEGLRTLVFA